MRSNMQLLTAIIVASLMITNNFVSGSNYLTLADDGKDIGKIDKAFTASRGIRRQITSGNADSRVLKGKGGKGKGGDKKAKKDKKDKKDGKGGKKDGKKVKCKEDLDDRRLLRRELKKDSKKDGKKDKKDKKGKKEVKGGKKDGKKCTPVDDDAMDLYKDTQVNTPVTIDIGDANGPNVDRETCMVTSTPRNGFVTDNGSCSFTYTPNQGFEGVDSFDYELCTLDDECDDGTVFIDVGSTVGPTAIDATVTTPKNTPIEIELSDNIFDPNDSKDVGFCTLESGPSDGEVDSDGSCDFTYTPDPDFVGTDEFTYKVCDEDGNCDTGVVTIIITDGNGPIAPDVNVVIPVDTPIDIDGGADVRDPDNNVLLGSCRVTSGASSGTVSNNGSCVFAYTPEPGFIGTDQFTYEICDAEGNCDSATVTITITEGLGPIAPDISVTTPQETSININGGADVVDPDDNVDLGSCTVTSGPSSGTVTNNGNCIFTYTPEAGFVGTDQYTYEICDTDNNCDSATVTIVIIAGIDPPNARNDEVQTSPSTPVNIAVSANDSDPNNNLDLGSCKRTSGPSNGAVNNIGNCVFRYTPDEDFVGTDVFNYEICNTGGECDTATVTILVQEGNLPPNARDDAVQTPLDTPVDIDAAANDSDSNNNLDLESCTTTSGPASGSVVVDDQCVFTYTPNTGFVGTDVFTYDICDTEGLCATATVTIDVVICGLTVEERCDALKNEMVSLGVTSAADIETSPQSDALNWLCTTDTRNVCPGDGYCAVQQRYVMATLYYATGGDDWTNCSQENTGTVCNIVDDPQQPGYNPDAVRFLDGADECEWYGAVCVPGVDQCIRIIQIEDIQMSGTIPSEIAKLSELRFLALEEGNIGGTIPSNLNELTDLLFLDLDAQQLTGTIAETIFDITTLQTLDLNENSLSGSLSPSIGDLTDLVFFQIDNNNMSGPIPDTFGSLIGLREATFEDNNFTGVMPASICQIEMSTLQGDCEQCNPVEPCCTGCQN